MISTLFCQVNAQKVVIKKDTLISSDSVKPHSPKLATLMSACVPGLGQVYNKKYWKVPVVYAGFGIIGYSFIKSNQNYKKYRDAYLFREDNDPTTIDSIFTYYSKEDLLINKEYYRRNRDLSAIIGVLWYVINIIDATVDAHLFSFDINDDLSLNVRPYSCPLRNNYYTAAYAGGITLSLNISKTSTLNQLKHKISL